MVVLPSRAPADALAAAAGVADPDPDLRALLRLAPRLTALARLPAPTAGGAFLFGAVLPGPDGRPLSATGVGATARDALAACLGEVAEILAQMAAPGDLAMGSLGRPPPEAALSDAELREAAARGLDPAARIGWTPAVALPHESPCLVPAPLALRDGRARPDGPPLSLGCAAGPDLLAARRAAAFELFERAARAEGRVASLDLATARAAVAALGCLRGGVEGPRVALRDITRPGGPPTVLARSDRGVGAAARATHAEAADAALREMVAAECAGAARPGPAPAPSAPPAPSASLDAAIAACVAAGFPLREVRLSPPAPGVAVVKLVCFGLPWSRVGP